MLVTARSMSDPPQLLVETPLRGRRFVRILHHGEQDLPDVNIQLVIGDEGIRWREAASDVFGYEMNHYEFVELAVDDSVDLYAVLRDDVQAGLAADLRILEMA